MKKAALLLVSGLFAASVAAPVFAEEGYGESMAAAEKGKMSMEKMEKEGGMMMGSHKMTGKVENIDHANGMLTLKTGVPDMRLHFPPAAIKDLKNGDTITVELGFSK